QAGLSWITVLRKQNNYRKAFDNFNPEKIARYNEEKINQLLMNPGIIRNRLKILAAIQNAKSFIEIKNKYGSFDNYIWRFVDYTPMINNWNSLKEIPPRTIESDLMSKELKKSGFKFVGSTICYAFMQAVGMVNDHLIYCFKHKQLL
ncbi:MAG: DNA-3-methyladenine glycosylase I, partial [Bacteroidales bacterium]|nr:DNA-3-methyladenine glycosylase I [Bacteroidales bacterium]